MIHLFQIGFLSVNTDKKVQLHSAICLKLALCILTGSSLELFFRRDEMVMCPDVLCDIQDNRELLLELS